LGNSVVTSAIIALKLSVSIALSESSVPGTEKPSDAVKSSSLPIITSTYCASRRLTSCARGWPPNSFHKLGR